MPGDHGAVAGRGGARRQEGRTRLSRPRLEQLVAVVEALAEDLAAWIWSRGDERVDARSEVVDPDHSSQHRHPAAHARFGDRPDASAWVDQRKAELLTAGGEPILTAFRASAPPDLRPWLDQDY